MQQAQGPATCYPVTFKTSPCARPVTYTQRSQTWSGYCCWHGDGVWFET